MIDRNAVLELMDGSPVVFFATVEGHAPRIRALENLRRQDRYPEASHFCRGEGFTCYFSTSGASGKVREIRSNPSVAAYYCDPAQVHGATVSGEAEVLTDPGLKRALWSDAWGIYWKGWEDPDYVVVRLKARDIRGWWGTNPFTLERSDW